MGTEITLSCKSIINNINCLVGDAFAIKNKYDIFLSIYVHIFIAAGHVDYYHIYHR